MRELPIPASSPKLLGVAEDEILVRGDDEQIVVIEASSTRVALRTFVASYPRSAARVSSGAWAIHFWTGAKDDSAGARIAWLAPGATSLGDDESAPCPIEELHALGEDLVVVPGAASDTLPLGTRVHPWIRDGRTGAWREERSLPAFEVTADDRRASARSVQLGDGAWVLFWNHGAFELREGHFLRTFEPRVEAPWFSRHLRPQSAAPDGFYFVESSLREVHRGEMPSSPLGELFITDVWRGPPGTIGVQHYPQLFVFDPGASTLAELTMVSHDHPWFLVGTAAGLLIGRRGAIEILSVAEMREAAARPKDEVVAKLVAPADAVTAMTEGLPTARARVATHRDRIVLVKDRELRNHTVDAPQWRVPLPETILAVGTTARRVYALDMAGTLYARDATDGSSITMRPIAPNPRGLAACAGERVAVLASGGVFLVENDAVKRVPFESPIAAAFGSDGTLVASGEDGRLAVIDRSGAVVLERTLNVDVRAIAPMSGSSFALLAERELLAFDSTAGEWTTVSKDVRGAFLATSADGARFAICPTEQSVRIASFADPEPERELRVSYATYSQPVDLTVTITGLAFLADDRLVVALDDYRANIVAPDGALKLDPFPGDEHARWLFFHPVGMLLAD